MAKAEKIKNFALTPANQATTIPPAAIKIEVPRSGCVATKSTGATKTTTGKNKYFKLFRFSIEVRWQNLAKNKIKPTFINSEG